MTPRFLSFTYRLYNFSLMVTWIEKIFCLIPTKKKRSWSLTLMKKREKWITRHYFHFYFKIHTYKRTLWPRMVHLNSKVKIKHNEYRYISMLLWQLSEYAMQRETGHKHNTQYKTAVQKIQRFAWKRALNIVNIRFNACNAQCNTWKMWSK